MRRDLLSPPREVAPDRQHGAAGNWPVESLESRPLPVSSERTPIPPVAEALASPALAEPHRRPLFHPKTGWFRRLERETSHFLSRNVYPRIPGISLPYDRILRRRLGLSEAEIGLPDLPPEFEGFTILLISDPHAGPFVSPAALQGTFERLQAVEPDAFVMAGDFVTSQVREFETHRHAFRVLRAPHGVFGVLGNHDHYTQEPERLRDVIEQAGIRMLHNRSVDLRRNGSTLSLAGVDDMLKGEPDLDAALDTTRSPVILVSHHPDLFFAAARRNVALMLSGHTHAGQVRAPGLGVIVRQSRYRLDEGRYRTGGTELVVSRGLGAVGVPWRVFCPPEAVLIRLTAAGC